MMTCLHLRCRVQVTCKVSQILDLIETTTVKGNSFVISIISANARKNKRSRVHLYIEKALDLSAFCAFSALCYQSLEVAISSEIGNVISQSP